MHKSLRLILCSIALFGLLAHPTLSAQTEVQAWGNITGMRSNGRLMRFESSLRLVKDDWRKEQATGRERNWTTYRRILQWQLTADYSPLSGGGIFGNDHIPLQPTQRFWNLKQLAQTPKNLHILPLTCSSDDLYVAALGDLKQKNYAFHVVNEGPEREVILSGLPEKVKRLQVYVTDANKNMERGAQLKVEKGKVKFSIRAACFMSLMNE
ncbi:MAG: hypothetical protein ACKV1O_23615 [Saprospiraceae bacterium]